MDIERQVLSIAERELGLPAGVIPVTDRLDIYFEDSLEWFEYIVCLRSEVGNITDEQAAAAETFEQLRDALAIPN